MRETVTALARRVEAATPARRDRAVDALRAFGICGVVLGHWLVTAVVQDGDGHLYTDSPLGHLPALTPLSWVLQTLAVFFLVGGYSAARSWESARARGESYGRWTARRLGRLTRPVPAVLGVWIPAALWLTAGDAGWGTVRTLIALVVSPLWFLCVFAALTAATAPVVALVRRLGPQAALLPAATVALVDTARFGWNTPEQLGWLNVPAGWLVPYVLGTAWAAGHLRGVRAPLALLAGGAAGTVALVLGCGYPASMVGVPGQDVSNLSPPTLAAVCFGLAQAGLALALRGPLRRLMGRPLPWMLVAGLNLSAMTVFLWHQTAMLLTTCLGLTAGPLPGLHTAPLSFGWALERLAWLPVFAVVLGLLMPPFRHREHAPARTRKRRAAFIRGRAELIFHR
ncbi:MULTISPECIES: acyltransferase [Streptomyces]|uniref:Acyltransferase n=1 Tax=Streptomyces luteosporeus TaxID=173856 RepID=A0ABN3TKM8_9ACTN